MTKVFDKTEKGREEIATRKYHLSPRIRSLLVMIDGKQTADELLKKVAGLGLNEQSMTELLQQGFVREAASSAESASASTTSTASTEVAAAYQDISNAPEAPVSASAVGHPIALASASPAEIVLPEGQTQFEAIYRFYNETIKSTIGLRGYGLQLKVEKAASIDDFRQLRKPYLEAVLKAQGQEMARSLRDRLDKLLYLGEPVPETVMTAGLHI